ncbi:hypothetical protein Tco_1120707 [Tanacetum coccineum]
MERELGAGYSFIKKKCFLDADLAKDFQNDTNLLGEAYISPEGLLMWTSVVDSKSNAGQCCAKVNSVVAVDQGARQADQAVTQPSPSEPLPSSSPPPVISATTKSEPTPDPTHPHVAEERPMTVDDLLQLVPKLITKVDSLEKELKQTKLTMGKALVKLVKKVKKMEAILKRRHVVLTDSEDEDAKNSSKQGRNLQDEGLDEMVRSTMKKKSEEFETPTQRKTSGEADISLKGLEAAETLAKVLTQRTKTYTRKVKTRLRRKLDVDEVSTGEGINTGFTEVNTAFEEINSGDESIITSPEKGQREGKAVLEEKSQLQAQEEAENARKAELQRQDALIAKRVQDELELSETQKNRMTQVQEATKYYTEDDWDSEDDWDPVKCQLKKLKPDELKEEFDKCVEKVEKFIPMNSELEASKLKRTSINLQAEVFKKQKITDVPDVTKDESVKREEKFMY